MCFVVFVRLFPVNLNFALSIYYPVTSVTDVIYFDTKNSLLKMVTLLLPIVLRCFCVWLFCKKNKLSWVVVVSLTQVISIFFSNSLLFFTFDRFSLVFGLYYLVCRFGFQWPNKVFVVFLPLLQSTGYQELFLLSLVARCLFCIAFFCFVWIFLTIVGSYGFFSRLSQSLPNIVLKATMCNCFSVKQIKRVWYTTFITIVRFIFLKLDPVW